MSKIIILTLSIYFSFNLYIISPEKSNTRNNFSFNQFNWSGKYKLSILGEKLNNGEMSGRDYTFTINKNKVILVTNSYHEPVFCDGEYQAIEINNQLEINYTGNNVNFCKQKQANFLIKNEKNKFYIKGSDFNTVKWLLLRKVKS